MRPIRRNYPTYNNWWYADRRYRARKAAENTTPVEPPTPEVEDLE